MGEIGQGSGSASLCPSPDVVCLNLPYPQLTEVRILSSAAGRSPSSGRGTSFSKTSMSMPQVARPTPLGTQTAPTPCSQTASPYAAGQSKMGTTASPPKLTRPTFSSRTRLSMGVRGSPSAASGSTLASLRSWRTLLLAILWLTAPGTLVGSRRGRANRISDRPTVVAGKLTVSTLPSL